MGGCLCLGRDDEESMSSSFSTLASRLTEGDSLSPVSSYHMSSRSYGSTEASFKEKDFDASTQLFRNKENEGVDFTPRRLRSERE